MKCIRLQNRVIHIYTALTKRCVGRFFSSADRMGNRLTDSFRLSSVTCHARSVRCCQLQAKSAFHKADQNWHASAAAARRSSTQLSTGLTHLRFEGTIAAANRPTRFRNSTVLRASQQQNASTLLRSFTHEGHRVEDGSSRDAVQFQIHKIAGDGSCLFRALAQGSHLVSTGMATRAFCHVESHVWPVA